MNSKIILFSIFALCLSGCGSWGRTYYGNYTHPERNFQQDQRICQGYAAQAAPVQRLPLQAGASSNTVGNFSVIDPYGQVYQGNYNQYTYQNRDSVAYNNLFTSMNNFSGQINQSNVYRGCMAQLGWVEISEEEYLRIRQQNQRK